MLRRAPKRPKDDLHGAMRGHPDHPNGLLSTALIATVGRSSRLGRLYLSNWVTLLFLIIMNGITYR